MSNPIYYPNRDMLGSRFPTNWSLLKRLMWVRITQGGSIAPAYETVTGNPVSFSTLRAAPLRQLSVAFSPVQNLNGYENPWPAGGGANKLEEEFEVGDIDSTTGQNAYSSTQIRSKNYSPVVPGAEYSVVIAKQGNDISIAIVQYDSSYGFVQSNWRQNGTTITMNANTSFIRIVSNAYYGATYTNDIAINYPSSVTTYSPYSNECPISGWDSLTVEQRGVNVWDEEWENGRFDLSTGALVADNNSYRSKNYIPAKGSTQYFAKSNTNVAVGCWNDSKQYIGRVPSSFKDASFTTLANTAYIKFYSAASSYAGGASINYPATDTAYHAYNPSSQSISITIGQTVYSGTLDVLTGVVKARPYFASYNGETLVGPWMSSMDKYVAGATPTVGAQVVDMGGAETTIQLTPQEVSSLLGENNMWSDANGDLTVEYRSN